MRRFLIPALLMTAPAWADPHGVTIVNSGAETIRRIEIGTGENRLRSQLPPGAQARIAYSTGCQADVRLGYDSGRIEAFSAIDVCSDPRIVTGPGANSTQGAAAGTTPAPQARPTSRPTPTTVAAASPVKAPLPVVPPWTGKSITKRFGGMD